MTVVYAPRTRRDIEELLTYIQERNPRAARSVSLAIEYAVQMCARNPYAASKTDEPNVYRRPLGKYGYAIFYRIRPDDAGIEIARVLHGARIRDLKKLPDAP
jgi:plasmid stabilization system protein ParE